jgi:hypothetical protein
MSSRFAVSSASAWALVPVILLGCLPGIAATAERQIDCGAPNSRSAVVVTTVTVGNLDVPCHAVHGPAGSFQPAPPFQADDDWLKDTTVYLFNRTNKTIAHVWITISFPQTGDGMSQATSITAYYIMLGRRPPVANFDSRTGKQLPAEGIPLDFGPGETLGIRLGAYYEEMQRALQDRLFVPLSKVHVYLEVVTFEDGMRWGGGAYSIPDPERPNQWKRMDLTYFPGDRYANWPPSKIKSASHVRIEP